MLESLNANTIQPKFYIKTFLSNTDHYTLLQLIKTMQHNKQQ